jgi:hypothetical protein
MTPAANGMVESVTGEPRNAVTATYVPTVRERIPERNVQRRIETSVEYMHPKFARDLIWGDITNTISPAAQYSLFADPLLQPPQSKLENSTAINTIRDNPNLFKIVCNINIKKLAVLLEDHPNQPFVQSVIAGLHGGFWPWAEPHDEYPPTHNEPQHPLRNEREREFMLSQREKEMNADCFLRPFNTLLPGMNVVLVHVVPKPPDDKLCLVVDHSASPYSINLMIDCQSIAGVKLDGIKTLGDSIREFYALSPTHQPCNKPLLLWKSDVAAVYRQMPMHPLWQIKQVVNINDQFCVNRCSNFGGRASEKIWWSFISLVLWIAVFKRGLVALKCYVDDHFSFSLAGDLELYNKYEAFLPSNQMKLLQL